ncbi:MAG: VTT domain-containing protein [Pseudomonadota bacterium]
MAGDVVAYRIGQAGGPWLTRLSERSAQAARLLTRAQSLAERHGALAVLVTRWPLSTLGPYLNLVAGAIGLNWRHFLAFCIVGELFWVSLYLSLGYFARSQLTETIEGASRATLIGGAIVLAAVLVLWLVSRLRQRR